MNNNFNIPQNQQDALLKMAGKQLGKDPNHLKKQLQDGNIQDILASLPPSQANQLKAVLSNPQALSQIMSNPQVAKMLGNFGNK